MDNYVARKQKDEKYNVNVYLIKTLKSVSSSKFSRCLFKEEKFLSRWFNHNFTHKKHIKDLEIVLNAEMKCLSGAKGGMLASIRRRIFRQKKKNLSFQLFCFFFTEVRLWDKWLCVFWQRTQNNSQERKVTLRSLWKCYKFLITIVVNISKGKTSEISTRWFFLSASNCVKYSRTAKRKQRRNVFNG